MERYAPTKAELLLATEKAKEHIKNWGGPSDTFSTYLTAFVAGIEYVKATPSPAKAEQELRPIKPLGNWLLAQTDLPPVMLPDGGYWYYGSVLQLLKRYLNEHESTTPPVKEAGQPAPSGLRWIRITTEDSLPPDDNGPNPKEYIVQYQVSDSNGQFPEHCVDLLTTAEIHNECQGCDWFEWLSDSPAPVQVDPLHFHKWIIKEGWEPHSSGEYWYKLDYPSQWPTPHTCLEHELIPLYTQSLQNKP